MSRQKQKKSRAAGASETAASRPPASPSLSRAEQQDNAAELLTALVLGGIALLRPWQDGMAFPAVNDYYLWVQAGLAALVAARMLVRREGLRFPLHVGAFAIFLAIALLVSTDTVQYNNSYRWLTVWAGHLLLFLVATQALRQPRSFAIVLTGFVVGAFAEAVFSVVHLKYYLPLVRERVGVDPSLVQRYFGAPEVTPEIARRLNINRAFGTFLFPNALAGYMVLCVPLAVGASVYSIQTLRTLLRRDETPTGRSANAGQATAAGLGAWAMAALAAYTALSFFHAVAYRDEPMFAHWIQWGLFVGALPLAIGAALYVVTKLRGLLVCLWTVASCMLPAFGLATLVALFYSFSRGGMLAFLGSTALTGGFLFVLLRKPGLLPKRWVNAGLVLLLCAVCMSTMGADGTPSAELSREGLDMSVDELANPATMLLRLSYWRTGLSMIADNFWTGVGPGNFGVMYPRYKAVGAGETDHAHNDYIQILAETGILGALAFCAFWGLFLAGGIRKLISMRRSPRLWLVAGLFASVLAFLLHAMVDFDFVNPSLASMAFLLAGVFCAATAQPDPGSSRYARPVAVAFLVTIVLAFGASIRVHRADALAGSETAFRTRLLSAQFFVFQAPEQFAKDRRGANIPIQDALALVPDLEALKKCGGFWVVEPGKTPRKLGAYEPLWPGTYLNISDPESCRDTGVEWVEHALGLLETADAIFPHDPIRAIQLSTWCDFLAEAAETSKKRLEWSDKAVAWAQEALNRSPLEGWFHQQYAAALWSRAQIQPEPQARLEDFFKSLEHYERGTVLFSSSRPIWLSYSQALQDIGEILLQSGETEKGEALKRKAEEAAKRAHEIRMADYHANRRRAGLE